MKRWLLVGALLLPMSGLVVLTRYFGQGTQPRLGPAATQEPRSLAEAEREYSSRRAAPAKTPELPPLADDEGWVDPEAPFTPDEDDAALGSLEPDEAQEASAERYRRARHGLLETHFAGQARGGDWARNTAISIRQALVDAVQVPTEALESLECRDALCRIEVTTQDEARYDETFRALLDAHWLFGGGPAFLTRNDAHGASETLVMFVGRQGMDLPDINVESVGDD